MVLINLPEIWNFKRDFLVLLDSPRLVSVNRAVLNPWIKVRKSLRTLRTRMKVPYTLAMHISQIILLWNWFGFSTDKVNKGVGTKFIFDGISNLPWFWFQKILRIVACKAIIFIRHQRCIIIALNELKRVSEPLILKRLSSLVCLVRAVIRSNFTYFGFVVLVLSFVGVIL